jgi:hypothetical protein
MTILVLESRALGRSLLDVDLRYQGRLLDMLEL